MVSKQLFAGLAVGALGAGFGFMLFGGEPEAVVTRDSNLNLLAQVVPNEPAGEPGDEEEVTEVRVVPPPVKKTTPSASVPETEALKSSEEKQKEPVVVQCSYQVEDKPERLGIISEVAWMGTGDDAAAEWVEIQNHIKGTLDVSGWQLVDKAEQIRAIVPEGVILAKNGFLVFERDNRRLQGATIIFKGAISNADEGLRLFDADCNLQDEVVVGSKWPAGTNQPKYTAERGKDLSWHTYYGDANAGVFGTPGIWNSSGPPPEPEPEEEIEGEPAAQVGDDVAPPPEPEPEAPSLAVISAGELIISEVVAGSASAGGDEFIELYNLSDTEIDLTGFSIKKKVLSSGNESPLVTAVNFEGKKVGAGSRFVIGHGIYADVSQMNWPISYSVAYAGNVALLYNPQKEVIDEVSWDLSGGQSYGCVSQESCAVQEGPNPGT